MGKYNHYYVSVSCDVQPDGLNMACWLSTQEIWFEDKNQYPNYYDRSEGDNIWHIHANCQLTINAVTMIVEYANHIIEQQIKINARRKVGYR